MQIGGLRVKGVQKTSKFNEPLITIITVVYNGSKTIKQTINSIINQTYKNIEYIIIDGGSTDGTIDIIKQYDNNIDYWQSEPDKGIYDAMNKGIGLAEGEYVYFLGCDDWLINKNILLDIKKYLNCNYDVISGRVWLVFKNGFQKIYDNRYSFSKEEDILSRKILSPHQGMFVKTDIMKKYPFDINYKVAADYKSLITLWFDKSITIFKIQDIIAYYSNDGTSNRLQKKRSYETNLILDEFNIWNKNWFAQLNHRELLLWYIKQICIKFGAVKIKNVITYCNSYLKHKIQKHNCEWDFCYYCNPKIKQI